jgi:hypothetical protein
MEDININNNKTAIKDNWEDSSESESEPEVDIEALVIEPRIIGDADADNASGNDVPHPQVGSNYENKDEDWENWEEYDGPAVCHLCGKADEELIILSQSRKVICFNDCTTGGYTEEDYADEDYQDELDRYDKKLDRYVSFR